MTNGTSTSVYSSTNPNTSLGGSGTLNIVDSSGKIVETRTYSGGKLTSSKVTGDLSALKYADAKRQYEFQKGLIEKAGYSLAEREARLGQLYGQYYTRQDVNPYKSGTFEFEYFYSTGGKKPTQDVLDFNKEYGIKTIDQFNTKVEQLGQQIQKEIRYGEHVSVQPTFLDLIARTRKIPIPEAEQMFGMSIAKGYTPLEIKPARLPTPFRQDIGVLPSGEITKREPIYTLLPSPEVIKAREKAQESQLELKGKAFEKEFPFEAKTKFLMPTRVMMATEVPIPRGKLGEFLPLQPSTPEQRAELKRQRYIELGRISTELPSPKAIPISELIKIEKIRTPTGQIIATRPILTMPTKFAETSRRWGEYVLGETVYGQLGGWLAMDVGAGAIISKLPSIKLPKFLQPKEGVGTKFKLYETKAPKEVTIPELKKVKLEYGVIRKGAELETPVGKIQVITQKPITEEIYTLRKPKLSIPIEAKKYYSLIEPIETTKGLTQLQKVILKTEGKFTAFKPSIRGEEWLSKNIFTKIEHPKVTRIEFTKEGIMPIFEKAKPSRIFRPTYTPAGFKPPLFETPRGLEYIKFSPEESLQILKKLKEVKVIKTKLPTGVGGEFMPPKTIGQLPEILLPKGKLTPRQIYTLRHELQHYLQTRGLTLGEITKGKGTFYSKETLPLTSALEKEAYGIGGETIKGVSLTTGRPIGRITPKIVTTRGIDLPDIQSFVESGKRIESKIFSGFELYTKTYAGERPQILEIIAKGKKSGLPIWQEPTGEKLFETLGIRTAETRKLWKPISIEEKYIIDLAKGREIGEAQRIAMISGRRGAGTEYEFVGKPMFEPAVVSIKPVTAFKRTFAFEGIISKQKPFVIQKPIVIPFITPKMREATAEGLMILQKPISKQTPAEIQRLEIKPMITLLPKSATIQKPQEALKPIQIFKQKQQQIQEQKLKTLPRIEPIEEGLLPPPILLSFGKPKKKIKAVTSASYQPYIKEKGQFRRFGKPTTMNEALDLGSEYVDRTPSARFKIQPTKQKPMSNPEVSRGYFKMNKEKFRGYKIKRRMAIPLKQEYIEKSKYRIDKEGEKRGITAKGIEAVRIKKLKRLFIPKKR